MIRALLVRGMLAGALAGLLAFGFASIFGEPQIDLAIGFEQHAHVHTGMAEPELVSRGVQSTIGLLAGLLLYGCAFGGIFALVFAAAHGRLGRFAPRTLAALLALAAFLVVNLVPQIKYPANPPAIGDPDTIGLRSALYVIMLACSAAAAVAALWTGRRLRVRLGTWDGALAGGAFYVAAVALAIRLLPPVEEVPHEFSAAVLWNFRLASLGIQAVMWTGLGLGFGVAAERLLHGPARRRTVAKGWSSPRA